MLTPKLRVALGLLAVIALVAGLAVVRRAAPLPSIPAVTVGTAPRAEACLLCHASTRGVGVAHASIGCSPCHGGNALARTEAAAHAGMDVLAGDLATIDRTCGQAACHPAEAARVQTSLMANAPGILAVDRFAFGERSSPDGDERDELGILDASAPPSSPAESHVRQLCAGCHLGARKERRGDLGEDARGGGCTACHLGPPDVGAARGDGPLHPGVSASVSERRCVGCHSRSGRIALSYRGTVELEPGDPRVTGHLGDGRPVGHASPDVHAQAGMTCVDCHTERELMGDGAQHRHVQGALDVACVDCHRPPGASTVDPDREAVAGRLRAAWARRGLPPLPSAPPLRTRQGTPLWRTSARARTLSLSETGEPRAIPLASDGPRHALRGHERLSCQACHAPWVPRCTSCHTRYDPAGEGVDHLSGAASKGRWIEAAGGNGFGPPLLAVGPGGLVGPFTEGMTLTLEGVGDHPITRTLWAPLDPHTTGKARACSSCHAPASIDDVFPGRGETTRSSARLLERAEVDRILRVGRCLGCHTTYEDPIYGDFGASYARLRRGDARPCKGKP